ncbi:hypothetical protein LCGC14_2229820 [marine sediment metagenome]|uniref:Uncharacterized protein n=1 Tax=marine sediment metagenome TaxID=412755 RepID=A0A0F9DW93_9ZZZZ
MSDVTVTNYGSIAHITPHTDAAVTWVEENIGQDNGYQPHWPVVLIEHRFIQDIVDGMREAGLEVER